MNEIEKKPRGNTAGCRGKEDPTLPTRINVLLPGEINQMLINLQGKIMMLEGQKLSKQAVLIRLLNSMLALVLVVLVSSCELNQEHIGAALQIVFILVIFFIIRFIYLMVKTTKNKIK